MNAMVTNIKHLATHAQRASSTLPRFLSAMAIASLSLGLASQSHAIEQLSDDELQQSQVQSSVPLTQLDAYTDQSEMDEKENELTNTGVITSKAEQAAVINTSLDYELYRNNNEPLPLGQTAIIPALQPQPTLNQIELAYQNLTPEQTEYLRDNSTLINQGLQPLNLRVNPAVLQNGNQPGVSFTPTPVVTPPPGPAFQ